MANQTNPTSYPTNLFTWHHDHGIVHRSRLAAASNDPNASWNRTYVETFVVTSISERGDVVKTTFRITSVSNIAWEFTADPTDPVIAPRITVVND